MTECTTITHDIGSGYVALLSPMAPDGSYRIQLDATRPVDCDGQGITITQATWSKVYDPDGDLTLSQQAVTGLWVSVLVTGSLDGKVYQLQCVITTSDGRVLPVDVEWRCVVARSQLRAA